MPNGEEEKIYIREIKRQAKLDRYAWFDDMLQSGDWSSVRNYRKRFRPQKNKMKNHFGEIVMSDEGNEIMTKYFEKIQWKLTYAEILPSSHPIDERLNISEDAITLEEFTNSIHEMKKNKASGPDELPSEFWKVLVTNGFALHVLLKLLNTCLTQRYIPKSWQHASIVLIFKKGDCSLP